MSTPKRGNKQKKKQPFAQKEGKPSKSTPLFLFGRHSVIAALTAAKRPFFTLWLQKHDAEIENIAKNHPEITIKIQDKSIFDSTFKNQNHQGIALQVGDLPKTPLIDVLTHPRLLMLDQITDPHNLGAVLRSADAFGFGAVIVPAHNSAPLTDVVAKTACGAMETVPVIEVSNLNNTIKALQEENYWTVGLAGEAQQTLEEFTSSDLPEKLCVIMGSEGKGLRRLVQENCDHLVKIPMVGSMESLNVSVATGITLHALMKNKH